MGVAIKVKADLRGLRGLKARNLSKAMARAAKKAGATALRDMKSEASKRVRKRKRLKVKQVKKALIAKKPRTSDLKGLVWVLNVSGETVRVSDYPHRQIRAGVSVAVNKGTRTLIRSAFVATMASGHRGVFRRRDARRLPIFAPIASRPVDALLHAGEPGHVLARGQKSFDATIDRLLAAEIAKGK